MMTPDPLARATVALGTTPEVAVRAPGRANLMGEHTDYNDGFVLPVALDLRTAVAGRRAEGRVRLRSLDLPGDVDLDIHSGQGSAGGWGRYVAAVLGVLREAGYAVHGIDGVVASDLPLETGLSSSAALEVAVALAVLEQPIEATTLATLCQRAENEGVGVRSGIMDQLASAAAVAGHALLLDCRSVRFEPVPVPAGLAIVVVDSGERRRLDEGDYNRRRDECEAAATLLGVPSLRDVRVEALGDLDLPSPLDGRVRHVVTENARALNAAEALRRDDRPALRRLFAASHASLATDFDVSTPNLDALVQAALATQGVVASRMTGAGFGGCTVSLVEADRAEATLAGIVAAYRERAGRTSKGWISSAGDGALALAAA